MSPALTACIHQSWKWSRKRRLRLYDFWLQGGGAFYSVSKPLARHPRLKVEFVISDRTDDLVAEGADMALRLGRLVDSGFGARLLASASRLVIAAPAYLAQRGAPETLADRRSTIASSDRGCQVAPAGASRERAP